jgi:hypothetical protein
MSKKILKTKVCVAEYCTNTSDSSEKIFRSVPAPAQGGNRLAEKQKLVTNQLAIPKDFHQ